MDTDARVAFRRDLVGERVVEIFGVVGVYREDRDLPIIKAASGIFGGHAVRQCCRFALDVGGKTRGEIEFFVDPEEFCAWFVRATEARRDRAGKLFAAVSPIVELDDDFIAHGDFDGRGLNEDRLDETRIVGGDNEGAT